MNRYIKITNLNKEVFQELKRVMGDVLSDIIILGPIEISQWFFADKNLSKDDIITHFGAIDFSLEMVGYLSDRDDNDEVHEVDLLLTYNNQQPDKLIKLLATKLTAIKNDVGVSYPTEL
jgi:hypothetical protein